MVVSLNKGTPNIDPKILSSLLKATPKGTPNFGKPPNLKHALRISLPYYRPFRPSLRYPKGPSTQHGLGYRVRGLGVI